MKKILLDTNFLMIPASMKVDIFSEIDRLMDCKYEVCVVDKTLEELKHIIESQKGRFKEQAKLALLLAEKKNVSVLKTESIKNVDEIILEIADSKLFIVGTMDSALKRQLGQKQVPVLILRQKNHLKIMG